MIKGDIAQRRDMKTREIECWVSPTIKNGDIETRYCVISGPVDPDTYRKAKLIIEVPEKRIEISESEFEKIFKGHTGYSYTVHEMKQKLFGKES